MTAIGTVETIEEATVYIKDLDAFLRVNAGIRVHLYSEDGSAACVEPRGRCPSTRGYDTQAADIEPTGMQERRTVNFLLLCGFTVRIHRQQRVLLCPLVFSSLVAVFVCAQFFCDFSTFGSRETVVRTVCFRVKLVDDSQAVLASRMVLRSDGLFIVLQDRKAAISNERRNHTSM